MESLPQSFSPGCALGWLALLGMILVGLAALRRSIVRGRARARERAVEIATALQGRGLSALPDRPFPRDLPKTPLVRGGRPKRCIEAAANGASLFVFDHEVAERPPLGRNVETLGSGDDLSHRSRHTIACLRDGRLALPAFEILPNIQGALHGAVQGMASRLGDTPGARVSAKLLGGLVEATSSLHDRRRPLPLPEQPALAEAFRVFGRDPSAIEAMLRDPVVEHLLAHPDTIACGHGEWLLCSRRVGSGRRGLAVGLLTPEETVELVDRAVELGFRMAAR